MMKILLIGDYPPPYGGVSVHVRQLARFLTQNGAVCRVIDIEPGTAPKEGAIRVKGRVDFLRRLVAFSAKGYEAHIHTNGHNFKSWAAIGATAWVGFVFNRRNIATLHSGHMPAYLSAAGAWRRRLIRLFLRPLGKVIAVSGKIEKALLELKVDSRRISVLPAFSLGDRSDAIPERARIWREKFKPLIVSAVYLEEEYGVSFLIEACGALQKSYPDLGCIIMGSGSQEGRVRREIQKREGEGRILLLGNVPHEVCLSIMADSDLFVRPTLFDGDAISVREALAFGIPAVASDVGFRPKGVLLFEPGNTFDLVRQMRHALQEGKKSALPGTERLKDKNQNLAFIQKAYEEVISDRRLHVE